MIKDHEAADSYSILQSRLLNYRRAIKSSGMVSINGIDMAKIVDDLNLALDSLDYCFSLLDKIHDYAIEHGEGEYSDTEVVDAGAIKRLAAKYRRKI